MDLEDKFKTGVLWQDLQHKELINLFKKLSDHDLMKSDSSSYSYTVGFLVMYASQHLSLEEGYMKAYEYPDLEHHANAHKDFIKKIKDFRKEHRTYSPEASEILIKNIKNWILSHILDNDVKLGEFIKLKEQSKT